MSREFFDEDLVVDGQPDDDLHGLDRLEEAEAAHAEDLRRLGITIDEDEAL